MRLGDKVAASLRGGVDKERGGFAEYVKVYADLAWVIPAETYTFEEAATIGIPLYTSVIALYGPNSLGLPQPGDANPPAPGTWVSGATVNQRRLAAHDICLALRLRWKFVCWTICDPIGQAFWVQCYYNSFQTQPRARKEPRRRPRLRCKRTHRRPLILPLTDPKRCERSTATLTL